MASGPVQTPTICFQCFEENGIPRLSTFSMQRIPHDGIVFNTCDRGHFSAFVSQQQQFEALSEIAIQAIFDGYYRESVVSFAAALERLYEFYVEVICCYRGICHGEYSIAWKALKTQSERQLGAFCICYLLENSAPAKLLSVKSVEFRNKVIHQGLLPSRDEAVQFGQAVADCGFPLLKMLKSGQYASALNNSISRLIGARSKVARAKGAHVSVGTGSSPFSLTAAGTDISIEMILVERAKRPDFADAALKVRAFGALIDSLNQSDI
jgi:hypothetical protein